MFLPIYLLVAEEEFYYYKSFFKWKHNTQILCFWVSDKWSKTFFDWSIQSHVPALQEVFNTVR